MVLGVSLEDAAEVASDNGLVFIGRIIVAGGAFIAFGMIFILVAGVVGIFFILLFCECAFEAFYSVE